MNKTFTAHLLALFLVIVSIGAFTDECWWLLGLSLAGLAIGMFAMRCKIVERLHG